jgi:zinc protease
MSWRRALLALPLPALLCLLACAPAPAETARRLTLPNDLRVVVQSSRSTDIVAIDLLLDISALDEPRDRQGVRYLVQRLLLRGTTHQSGDAMARQLAAVGGVMDTTVGLDYVEIYALVPADGFDAALRLLADAVQSPAFLPEEISGQKVAARQAARAARDDPFQETYLAFREALYDDHPYARPTFGDARGLAALTREDLAAFHAQYYRPNSATLAICGGIGEGRATRAAREAFGDWASESLPFRERPEAPRLAASLIAARELPVRRAHLILGFASPAVADVDYYPLQVIDSLLSGGASSRLPQYLREELGLVYHISSFYPTLAGNSHFAIYAATAPHQLLPVKSAVLQALTRLIEEPVPPDELTRAKRYLLGSYALSHQRMKDQAYALAWYETLGLGCDFAEQYAAGIEAVTAADVQRAASAIFTRFALAVTMPHV